MMGFKVHYGNLYTPNLENSPCQSFLTDGRKRLNVITFNKANGKEGNNYSILLKTGDLKNM